MIENVRDDLSRRTDTVRGELDALKSLIRMAIVGAVLGAIYVELRKPPAERTWNGKLLGIVPYDFRLPSLDAVRQAYWNPRSPKIITPRPLGVGWAVNVPTLLRRLGVRNELTRGR